ncbi:MAG: hypothetical protein DRJ47_04530 [Thermoprotei archaeon]|nr:MAG: hypothetical protein DRJ47_04530 [Thermoprotei archaeon]
MNRDLQDVCKFKDYVVELAKARVNSLLVGEKPSPWKGLGVDVEDFREYTYGDDYRNIDWKISARLPYIENPRFVVKEFGEEKALNTIILLDASASMGFGLKWATALTSLIIILEVARKLKDRIGLIVKNSEKKLLVLPTGASGLDAYILSKLCRGKIKPTGHVKLREVVDEIYPYISRRFFIVLITDFAHEVEDFREAIKLLKEKSLGLGAIMVQDKRELKVPSNGLITLKDLETESTLGLLRSEDPTLLSAILKRHFRAILLTLKSHSIPYVQLNGLIETLHKTSKIISIYGRGREATYV